MELSSLVYKPPSDDQQPADDVQDEEATGNVSRVRRRQSAVPRKPPAKRRKEFYTDEHPEVPKVLRASRNKDKMPPDPSPDDELSEQGSQTTSHTRPSSKRVRKD